MIPGIRHPMTPSNYLPLCTIVKKKLSTILPRITTLGSKPTRDMPQPLHNRSRHRAQHTSAEIPRPCTHRQRHYHTQVIIQFARRVCIDREWTASLLDIVVYQARVAAADNDDRCAVRELAQVIWFKSLRYGTDILLTVLLRGQKPGQITTSPGQAYPAEKVPDKDHQHPFGAVRSTVDTLERVRFALVIQDVVVLYFVEFARRGRIVVHWSVWLDIFSHWGWWGCRV